MSSEIVTVDEHPLTANAVVARVRLIQEVMTKVMKKDTHYGIIPGCQKPSLWKPGAEQLLVTFRISPDEPKVEDLSTEDAIRYRVTRVGRTPAGAIVAAGVGECSSDEEKYKWRAPVCDGEFEATQEDRKRFKWKRDNTSYRQVRTNPADVANTILKMADKRAFVAMTLLATAASDIFTQDLEDLPEEVAQSIEGAESKPPIAEPKPKADAKPAKHEEATPAKGPEHETLTATFVPQASSAKPTKKEGQTRYAVRNGDDWYSTFDDDLGAILTRARENKTKIVLSYVVDGTYLNIVGVENAQ